MDDKLKKAIITVLAAAFLIVAAGVFVYIGTLDEAVETSVVSTMKELSEHDLASVRTELSGSWKELSSMYERMRRMRPDTIQAVCSRLNLEQESQRFEIVSLIDSEGHTYSGMNIVKDRSKEEHVKRLLAGENEVAINYSDTSKAEQRRELLAYAVRLEPFEVAGVKFIGIAGYTEVQNIEKRLKLRSFEERGSTSVIDKNGYYIVTQTRSPGISTRDNFFDRIVTHYDGSNTDTRRIQAKIKEGRPFYEKYDSYDGHKRIVYYTPMRDREWTMLVTVPGEVMDEMTGTFILPALMMLLIITLAMLAIGYILIKIVMSTVSARAQAKASSALLSNMSHEIRTPLNGLIGLNDLMKQNAENPEKIKEYVYKSEATGKYLITLVNDILDMSKIQAGKAEIIPKPFSLANMIVTIYTIVDNEIDKKDIRFSIEPEIRADHIIGDESRIEQILINILSNAVKFTDEGGQIIFRIRQTLLIDSNVETVFEIEDDGCGMSKEFQKKIFEAFSQERYLSEKRTSGTGLGMAISSLLSQKMGGSLTVDSEENVGSCFTFSLVNKIVTDEADLREIASREALEPEPESGPGSGPEAEILQGPETGETGEDGGRKIHILVAEDNELNAEILLELLEIEGFTADHAADGEEVVEMFQASGPGTYDLILMDVQMPKQNGYEAAKAIRNLDREDAKRIAIFACTANAFQEDEEKAFACGMNGFITKPINIQNLTEKIKAELPGGGYRK